MMKHHVNRITLKSYEFIRIYHFQISTKLSTYEER